MSDRKLFRAFFVASFETSASTWSIKRLMDIHSQCPFINGFTRYLGSYAIFLAAACRVHVRFLISYPTRCTTGSVDAASAMRKSCLPACLPACHKTQVLVVSHDLSRRALEKNENPRSDPAKSTATTVSSECSAHLLSALEKVLSIEVPVVGSMLSPFSFLERPLSEISASAHSD